MALRWAGGTHKMLAKIPDKEAFTVDAIILKSSTEMLKALEEVVFSSPNERWRKLLDKRTHSTLPGKLPALGSLKHFVANIPMMRKRRKESVFYKRNPQQMRVCWSH